MEGVTINPFTGVETHTSWRTPKPLFHFLHHIYHFEVDAAADGDNHLLPFWYGPGGMDEDALTVESWASPAWCNPPYGKGIDRWLEKFVEQSSQHSNTIVALLPARTETLWWAKGIVPYADIIFLTGRVPFVGPHKGKKSQPDHPSAICIYSPLSGGSTKWWDWRKDVNV
jgi:phage N-6-adenine-methyltransferase